MPARWTSTLENSGGVLTVRFDNGSQLILSRQAPLRQLWVAARSGGFHFDYDAQTQTWISDSNAEPLKSAAQPGLSATRWQCA
jgi:CyaY protein